MLLVLTLALEEPVGVAAPALRVTGRLSVRVEVCEAVCVSLVEALPVALGRGVGGALRLTVVRALGVRESSAEALGEAQAEAECVGAGLAETLGLPAREPVSVVDRVVVTRAEGVRVI